MRLQLPRIPKTPGVFVEGHEVAGHKGVAAEEDGDRGG
jgi:hypothetical protein